MIFINFSHLITEEQLSDIEALTGRQVERIIHSEKHYDESQGFAGQASAQVAELDISPEEWQSKVLLISLPSYSHVAGLILAEIHGRCSYFPSIVRRRRVEDVFEVAEILNLQRIFHRSLSFWAHCLWKTWFCRCTARKWLRPTVRKKYFLSMDMRRSRFCHPNRIQKYFWMRNLTQNGVIDFLLNKKAFKY